MEHEVAKLIGAPPGYLGHRETQPMLTQQKLSMAASERSSLSLVLFDEVEKAAHSLGRLLLGILDKAVLRLGDNTVVNFENSLIFLTSNLGSRDMLKEIRPTFGFESAVGPSGRTWGESEAIGGRPRAGCSLPSSSIASTGLLPTGRWNERSLAEILDQHIEDFQRNLQARLGPGGFGLVVSRRDPAGAAPQGCSVEFGARELKRTLHRHLTEPLAALVVSGGIEPGSSVHLLSDAEGDRIFLRTEAGEFSADGAY